jgi:hypothetical protein
MAILFLLEVDRRGLRTARDGFASILSNSIKNHYIGLKVKNHLKTIELHKLVGCHGYTHKSA